MPLDSDKLYEKIDYLRVVNREQMIDRSRIRDIMNGGEAAVKALGTGIGNGISWQHVEVRNNDLGAPELHFSGEFAAICKNRGITRSVISISDEQHYAVATVILESE